ncbi:hypothetical protein GCM10027612_78000 [Microbispora bryophytorum subsp. camponoti]
MPLEWGPASDRPDLLADPVAKAVAGLDVKVEVAEIDPELSDTAAFCERYGVAMEDSVNCVVVAAKRGGGRGTPRSWCSPPHGPTSTESCAAIWTRGRRPSRRRRRPSN